MTHGPRSTSGPVIAILAGVLIILAIRVFGVAPPHGFVLQMVGAMIGAGGVFWLIVSRRDR